MELLSLVYRQYRWPFIAITLLSLLSAVSGIGVIAFINQSLIESVGDPLPILGQLVGLVLLLLVITLGSQLALTTLGHHFVYRFAWPPAQATAGYRRRPSASNRAGPLLASLPATSVRSPSPSCACRELVQGLVLTLGSIIYLGLLSPRLARCYRPLGHRDHGGGLAAGERVYRHLAHMRQAEDRLYQNYQSIIAGCKGWRSTASVPTSSTTSSMSRMPGLPGADHPRRYLPPERGELVEHHDAGCHRPGLLPGQRAGLGQHQCSRHLRPDPAVPALPCCKASGALPTLIAAQVAFDR